MVDHLSDKTSTRKVNDQSVSADEKRLLGVAEYDFSKIHSLLNLTRSRPTPADAVKVPIPTSRHPEDMASYKTVRMLNLTRNCADTLRTTKALLLQLSAL